jgi:hypothetical protein
MRPLPAERDVGELAGPVPVDQRPCQTDPVDAALAGLLGASIGAISGVCGGFVAGWQQRKAEALRWQQARADELRKEERRSLLELTSLLAEGSQAAAWLCWAATVKPASAVAETVPVGRSLECFRPVECIFHRDIVLTHSQTPILPVAPVMGMLRFVVRRSS